MTPTHIVTVGATGPYTVSLIRRDAKPQDGYHGPTVVALMVSKGDATSEAFAFEDSVEAPRHARFAGLAVLAALSEHGA